MEPSCLDHIALPEFVSIAGGLEAVERDYLLKVLPGFMAHAVNDPWQPATTAEKAAWDILIKHRCISDFTALPARIQQELVMIRNYVHRYSPEAPVKLAGSWPRGNWADEYSSSVFRAMRTMIRKKPDTSDLDLVIGSEYPFTRKELQTLVTTKIDLWKVNYDRITGIVF